VDVDGLEQARLEHAAQRPELALGGGAALPGTGVAIPGVREALAVRAATAAVRAEHRAHATVVRVGAGHDRFAIDRHEHRLLRRDREHVYSGS